MSIQKQGLNITDIYKDDLHIHQETKLSEFENDLEMISREEFDDLSDKVQDLQLFKFPNVTIFGEPTIQNGQISGFQKQTMYNFHFWQISITKHLRQ